MIAIAAGLALLLGGGAAAWLVLGKMRDEAPERAEAPAAASEPSKKGFSGEQLNLRLLQSSAFIVAADRRGVSVGSGVLVHRSRRLLLTNYHVAGDKGRLFVYFPAYDTKQSLITEIKYYADRKATLGINGSVVSQSKSVDLALIELERVPNNIVAIPLAVQPAATGSTIYSIGGSGVDSDALWRLTTGTVRGRHKDTHRYRDGQEVSSMLLETQSPVNPGDSGGPTISDRGELVGIVASFDSKDRLVSQSIDLTEVSAFLQDHARRSGRVWEVSAGAPPISPAVSDPVAEAETPATLAAKVKSGSVDSRLAALKQLEAMGNQAREVVPGLVLALDDSEERIRLGAASALKQIGPPSNEDLGCITACSRAAANTPGSTPSNTSQPWTRRVEISCRSSSNS